VKAKPVWQLMQRPLPVKMAKPLTSEGVSAAASPATHRSKRVGGDTSVRS
jgi:hypothetical protein